MRIVDPVAYLRVRRFPLGFTPDRGPGVASHSALLQSSDRFEFCRNSDSCPHGRAIPGAGSNGAGPPLRSDLAMNSIQQEFGVTFRYPVHFTTGVFDPSNPLL